MYSESFIAQKGIIPINKRCPKETSLPCQTIRTTEAPYIYKKTKILDIGSGIGGPARYIANKTGAEVTAIELQSDQNN